VNLIKTESVLCYSSSNVLGGHENIEVSDKKDIGISIWKMFSASNEKVLDYRY
jgi:hypothetical protein